MASATGQKLPQKENAIFKKVVRSYECKQYKNALKYCRQILSNPKFCEHGETLAMKGLILNSTGKKNEANEFVKKGLKNDLRSHVCWHVYGLVHRSNKKYDEAVKCYRNALKWDKENIQIYRDLSIVQLQMREIEGFRDSRYNLLKLRPSQQSSWVGYSLAYYLLKDYDMALKVVSEYRKTMIKEKVPYEYSEVVLYEVMVMKEARNFKEALQHLDGLQSSICDVLFLSETKASIYMEQMSFAEAEVLYRELINRNPENALYLKGLEECLHLESDALKLANYQELASRFPRSMMIRKTALVISSGEVFRGLVDRFLRSSLQKSSPSIFVSIRVHYDNAEKVGIIEELVSGYLECLRTCQRLDQDSSSSLPEPPSTLLWTIVLLAQHFDMIGNSMKALELIEEAIHHTPTDIQLYMIKAKIYKHAGDVLEAAKWMEEARILDTADRFVNCKCVKYFFRVNQVEHGIDIASLFTREGLPPLETMDDMQCMWFQTELAHAYYRLGKLGEALRKLHEIDKHFMDMIDDQFDFHSYCLRKTTLRSYIGVLRLEDKLREHPFYVEAAKIAIEIYLFLHDHPEAKGTMNGPTTVTKELSASELKKLQRKERKAQHKAQAKAQEEKKENKAPSKGDQDKSSLDDRKVKFVARDLLNVENPLEEAIKFLTPLQTLSSSWILPHLLAYSIYSRKRKFLLMLQSIKRARSVDTENGELHAITVDFILAFEAEQSQLQGPVKELICCTRPALTQGKSLLDLNRDFMQRNTRSLGHMISGSQVLYRLDPNCRDEALAYVTDLSDSMEGRTLENCTKVQKLLQSDVFGHPDLEILATYEEECSKLFPLATAFRAHAKKLVSSPDKPCSLPITQVKEVAAKNISASGGGAVVLKETALSMAAMSDLSGDINDIPATFLPTNLAAACAEKNVAAASAINNNAPDDASGTN